MKQQMVKANQMSQVEMMNTQSMMGVANFIQKLGKGKRKFNIKIEKYNKKFLAKVAAEMKKQIAGQGENPQMKNVTQFFDYLEKEAKNPNEILQLSYEELEFLKKTLVGSAQQMAEMKFKWYQFLKKMLYGMMVKQYKALIQDINK